MRSRLSPEFCLSGLSVVRMSLVLALGGKHEALDSSIFKDWNCFYFLIFILYIYI